MAIRVLEESFISEAHVVDLPETFLPSFPNDGAILAAFPTLVPGRVLSGKFSFVPWIDFAMEYPDEIWETDDLLDQKFYHYMMFVEKEEDPPAFVVEVSYADEVMQINNFSLVLSDAELQALRCGDLVYSRAKEWEREKLVRALNERALSRYDEDRLDEARELIDSAINLSGSGGAYLFNNRGLICWKMGMTDQAKRDFLESISLDEANGDPYFNIGLIYFDESDYTRALQFLGRAVEINPVDSQFLTELGHLYLELNREEEALDLFGKAFENNPGDPQVDFHLGYYFLYKKHQPTNAVKYYDAGLKKDPDDQFALADLAVAHWLLGNTRKTLEIHRALQENPRLMPYAISRLVYLNMEMGDYDTALRYYKQALRQKEPFEPEWLHYNAALVYAKTGRPKKALDILNLAVRMGGEAVIKRAMSEKALVQLKRMADFKKLIKLPVKRRTR
ncbi:MAG TPA: tetratricopeptide repeat protein [Desulfomonilaceae bacterium]|nr:tetratricopeptide repeat protein [Desulfomonilaceae bacterium]